MRLFTTNRKIEFEYFVEDEETVGIVLQGWEVKPIIAGKMSIAESYVKIIGGELFLIGSRIEPTDQNSDPIRSRKLLATKKQIDKYSGLVSRDGYTLVIKDVHRSDSGKIKATLCICKGKKKHDKRQTIKERDVSREMRRQDSL